jgi:uroporphyrinogen-III synthase
MSLEAENSEATWAILGTASTAKKIARECEKISVQTEVFKVVSYSVYPGISGELARINGLDDSVFTSQKASELVYKNSSQKLKELIRFSNCFSIGPATAKAVKRCFEPRKITVAHPHTSDGLIAALRNGRLGRVALFSSIKRSDALREYLFNHSAVFFEPRLYDLGVRKDEAVRFAWFVQESSLKGVVFTCSTAVSAVTEEALPSLKSLKVLAMGPRTKKTLEDLGVDALLPQDSKTEFVALAIKKIGSY